MIKLSPTEQQVMALIGEPTTPKEIAQALGKRRGTVWMCLQGIVAKGRLKRVGYGRYWFARPDIDGVDL